MDRLLLRPAEAAELLGIGRSKMYALLSSGAIPLVRLGGSLRVPADLLREWVGEQAIARAVVERGEGRPRAKRGRKCRRGMMSPAQSGVSRA